MFKKFVGWVFIVLGVANIAVGIYAAIKNTGDLFFLINFLIAAYIITRGVEYITDEDI